jgi:hypothetical protein
VIAERDAEGGSVEMNAFLALGVDGSNGGSDGVCGVVPGNGLALPLRSVDNDERRFVGAARADGVSKLEGTATCGSRRGGGGGNSGLAI